MKLKNWMVAGFLGIFAAIVYFASVVSYAFPGESARLQVLWAGLNPSGTVSYPLMSVFAKALGGGNLIAPVCGVLAVLLVYFLVSTFLTSIIDSEHAKPQANALGRIAGATAAIVFMLTPAVREAASHLEPRLFDVTWAFLSFAVLIPYARAPKMTAWLFPILMGAMVALGFTDTALFLTLAPFYLASIPMVELKNGRKPYVPMTLFAASFLVTFFLAIDVFGLDLTPFLKATAKEFKEFHSTTGWIFVMIFSTIPFLISLFACMRSFNEKPGFIAWVFHASMSFFVILSVATPLSPSSLMEKAGVVPVLTSAYVAATVGYLMAYWWLFRRRPIGMTAGVILVFVMSFSSLWNLFTFDGDRGAFADEVARKVLADLGSRTWFVTDGTLDDHLQLVAAKEGRELNLIALQRDLDTDYLDRLSQIVRDKQVGGSKNEALVLSLSLGVLPFVQDWFAADPTVGKEVAIWGAPDLWYSSGLKPVPEFLFFGSDTTREPDWSEWKRFDALLTAPEGWGSYRAETRNPVEKLRFNLRRHLGLVANNRGVWLQDSKKDDDAFAMYELVMNEIDADNVCSLFNEIEMAGKKHPKALAKKRDLERRIKTIIDDKTRRYVIWRLGSFYGYIRNPEMFVRLGFTWARSGRPGDALAQIRRAIDFVPTEKRATLLNMMAALYANENDRGKSRAIYESILAKNANDHDALMGMMRLKLLDGDSKSALNYLERAVKASPAESQRAKIELSLVAMMKNDLLGAKALLQKALDADSKNLQAWSLLAAVSMQQVDGTKDKAQKAKLLKEIEEKILPMMEKHTTNPYDYYVQTTKAFLLLRQGESRRREARDAFLVASRARPDSSATQDLVLGLDISLDDRTGAERHARDVLRKNRNAPLANYVMGSLAIRRGQYREAEAFLRKAADAPQPNVLALNDLAEVLRRTDKLSEAERYVRRGIELAPKFYILRETLAVILMDQKKNLDEATASINKAIELAKNEKGTDADVRMYATLARAQVLSGDRKGALSSIRRVKGHLDELTEYERNEFEEIRKSVE